MFKDKSKKKISKDKTIKRKKYLKLKLSKYKTAKR